MTALLLDYRTRRLLITRGAPNVQVPPGSTLKPLILQPPAAALPCPRKLQLAGRSFDCTHPQIDTPVDLATAIAYSCNCFAAAYARRFAPGELARHLAGYGLASLTGLALNEVAGTIQPAATLEATQLQALGEAHVLVTPLGLLMAYHRLAARAAPQVLEGLEGAVKFGTARRAAHPRIQVAGKTGSVLASTGGRIAWFAGFAPSRNPQVVVTVVTPGHSGGADAAPIAQGILETYFKHLP